MPKKPKTKKIKDTDYLTISARIRGMENTLMNRDKMEQLLETHSDEEVSRWEAMLSERNAALDARVDAAISKSMEQCKAPKVKQS